MSIANALSEQNGQATIDHRYNNAGRAWQRDQAVQQFGAQQLDNVNYGFKKANSSGRQSLARRGLTGGSADLSQQAGIARGLQDARAGISGQMLSMGNQLTAQDEQARQGLSGQYNGALDVNTQSQQALSGLAAQLSSNSKDINNGMINGVVGADVGAYNQYRKDKAAQSAMNAYKALSTQSRAPTSYDYLNY